MQKFVPVPENSMSIQQSFGNHRELLAECFVLT